MTEKAPDWADEIAKELQEDGYWADIAAALRLAKADALEEAEKRCYAKAMQEIGDQVIAAELAAAIRELKDKVPSEQTKPQGWTPPQDKYWDI